MKVVFLLAFFLTAVFGDDDRPIHSKPWICTHLHKRVYDNAIWNMVATAGVDCFEDLMVLPEKLKGLTPVKTFQLYTVSGPFIGKSKTHRAVSVLADEVDTIDLGSKIENVFAVQCLNCTAMLFDGDFALIACKDLSMEECPERLSKELYWNPPGKITYASDAEFCSFSSTDDTIYYFCKYYEPDLDVDS
ncbi:uncharacterized protein [Ptychodera flava]|uniref:uncharacterized protein n=1 Tax=Ptychodera flava TaxID=63121 RepID=UPI00396A2B7D